VAEHSVKAAVGREILQRHVLRTEVVEVDEWGGKIILREMSAAQVVEFVRMNRAQDDTDAGADMRRAAWTLITCWVDEAGDPILEPEDIDVLLATQPASLINRLSTRAGILSGMIPDAAAVAEKNSGSSQSEESGIA
jgi:hypothetical protein